MRLHVYITLLIIKVRGACYYCTQSQYSTPPNFD